MPTHDLTNSPLLNAVLSAALIGLMGWTLLTVHNLSKDLSVMNATLQFTIQDRYTSTEAKADNLVLKAEIRDLKDDVASLRLRVKELESNGN